MIGAIQEGLIKPWGELALYHDFALRMSEGQLPYKDFFPEYPPLSLLFLNLPLIFGTEYYTLAYYGLVFIFLILSAFLILKMNGRPFAFWASVLVLGGLFWDRFDIFPAFFSLLALYFALKKNLNLSFLSISLGFLTKIYPLLLILPISLYFIKSWRKIIVASLFFIAPVLITISIILGYGGKEGLIKFIQFQGKRGMHLEAVRITPLLIKHLRGEINLETTYEHNTFEVIQK